MIKINRSPKPNELTVRVQRELTQKFIKEKKSVWNKPYIKQALLQMSHRKCVYCEALVGEEAKYMEVEHYCPKNLYPQKVVEWENLFPACKRCNVKKGEYDTGCHLFIHPENDLPKNHLVLKAEARVIGKDDQGKASIEKLDLNHYDSIRKPRLRIIYKLRRDIADLHEELSSRTLHGNMRLQKKVQRKVYAILQAMCPKSAYSAYIAGTLLNDVQFNEIIIIMKDTRVWKQKHEQLMLQASYHAFEIQ